MRTAFSKHAIASALASMTVVLVGGGIAAAHIDPDPIAMEAGTTGTVSFKIEHGCDGSPTNDMKFQIPAGVTGVSAVAKDGWTATVTGDTLEFKGGSIAADQEDHFDITFTAPTQAGDIRFPIIQTCDQGELAWIEVPAEGAAEPEHPAPTVKITSGPPTSADLTPAPEETDAPTGTVVTSATALITTAVAPADDSSNTGTVVVIVIVAAVVVGGGAALLIRRTKAAAPKV